MKLSSAVSGLSTAALFCTHGASAATSSSSGLRQFGQTINGHPAGPYSDFAGHYEFGSTVKLSSDGLRMAVGAPNTVKENDKDADKRGAVYVYERDVSMAEEDIAKSEWRQIFRLLGKYGEGMGESLAFSEDGSVLAVRRFDDPSRDVQTFQWDADTETFVLMGRQVAACDNGGGTALTLGKTTEFSFFRNADWMAVSCESHDSFRGKVEVLRFDVERQQWMPFVTLEGSAQGDRFGWNTAFVATEVKPNEDKPNLSVEMIHMAVSSPNFDGKRGMVQVFQVDRLRESSQVGSDIVGETAGEQFGFSLAQAKSTLVVGAPQSAAGGVARGSVKVFGWSGNDWDMTGESLTGTNDNDRFGRSVAISSDSGRVAASSIHYDRQKGKVVVYEREGDLSSAFVAVQETVGESNLDRWGFSVSLNEFGSMVAASSSRSKWLGKKSTGSVQVFLDDTPFCGKPSDQGVEHQFLARNVCRSDSGVVPTDVAECVIADCVWVSELQTSSPSAAPSFSPTGVSSEASDSSSSDFFGGWFSDSSSSDETTLDSESEDESSTGEQVLGTLLGAAGFVLAVCGFIKWKNRNNSAPDDENCKDEEAKSAPASDAVASDATVVGIDVV